MAEAMLRDRLAQRGIDAHVHSVGLLEGGMPMTPETLEVLKTRGLDGSAHESRRMTADIVRNADLVIGMTRRHVIEAVVMARDAWPRAFTLKELVRRGQDVGPLPAGQPLDEWLHKAAAGRTTADMLGESPLDDVSDPVANPELISFDEAATEISGLVDRLVRLVWGAA